VALTDLPEKPTLRIRDRNLQVVGEIDDYTSLTVTSTYNDVGAWTLELSAESAKVPLLDPRTNPGGGIVVLRDDAVLLSGPVRSFVEQRSQDEAGTVAVAGPDDNVVLADTDVRPSPTAAVRDQGQFYAPARTDAETIMWDLVNLNVGPGAVAARRHAGLVLAPNQHRGRVHSAAKMRLATVLEELQRESVASQEGADRTTQLGFRVVQVGDSLEFEVIRSVDRIRTATFSFDLGNLAGYSYTLTAPTATSVIVGTGASTTESGARIATTMFEFDRADTVWPGRVEKFVDVGEINVTVLDDLDRASDAADAALDEGAGQVGLTLTPIDTAMLRFGRDYQIGDWVTVVTPRETVQERVVQIGLAWSASEGEAFAAGVGTPGGQIVAPTSRTNDVKRLALMTRIQALWQRRSVRPPYWTVAPKLPTRKAVR
jgi:hypothetical protein